MDTNTGTTWSFLGYVGIFREYTETNELSCASNALHHGFCARQVRGLCTIEKHQCSTNAYTLLFISFCTCYESTFKVPLWRPLHLKR